MGGIFSSTKCIQMRWAKTCQGHEEILVKAMFSMQASSQLRVKIQLQSSCVSLLRSMLSPGFYLSPKTAQGFTVPLIDSAGSGGPLAVGVAAPPSVLSSARVSFGGQLDLTKG